MGAQTDPFIPNWLLVSYTSRLEEVDTDDYSLLGDSLNTTVTVVATLQNSVVSYSTLTLTYLFIVGIAAQLAGIWGFWTIQKRFKLSTKVMFDAVMVGILLLDGWGMIGSKYTLPPTRKIFLHPTPLVLLCVS